MTKLKDFLEVYKPKAPDEQKFVDKHVTIKFKDRNEVGGKENGDDVFNASNVKTVARKNNRHGYDVGEDEKVYEEVDIDLMDENELLEFALDLLEKTLTPAELKKREEIAKAIERENPKMPMGQKMAIATAQAKKVAEGTMPTADEPTDANKKMAQKVRDLLAKEKKPVKEENDEGWYAHREMMGNKGVSKEDWKKGYRMNLKGERVMTKKMSAEEVEDLDELSVAKLKDYRTKARADAYDADDVDDERRYRKRAAGSNTAGKKIVRQGGNLKEEPLDELSNKTLGSYVKKATNQAFNKGFAGGANLSRGQEHEKEGERQVNKAVKRVIGVNKAVNKMTKEEAEDLDETSAKKAMDYLSKSFAPREAAVERSARATRYNPGDRKEASRLLGNKMKGAERAKKIIGKSFTVKEEAEDIEESAKVVDHLIKRYGNNVRKSHVMSAANDFGVGYTGLSRMVRKRLGVNRLEESVDDVPFKGPYSKPGPSKDEYGNTIKNVPRHLARKAMKALTKEDIIDRAVNKYVPEELKFTPEERMIKRLEGLREDHIIMIMSLFESLNDTNQSKMIDSAETEDGVNQLLDFAINNRGV